MTHPAAYLRRSYVDDNSPGDISRDAQRAAVAKLAKADGHNGNLVEYDDWGVSADVAKSAKRTAYARLLDDMDAGKVTAVYAFDVDRLYRDPRDLIRLQDAAQRHQVRIVTTGGPLAIGDGDDPAAEGFAFMGAVFGRMELQKSKKRNRAAREARRERGDRFGHPPYGFIHVRDDQGRIIRVPNPDQPMEPILNAYREAGTMLGAVKLLNARGIPSPKGKRWGTSALTRVIEFHAPELLPRKGASGKRIRTHRPNVLAQLVRCHCGATMTPNTARRQLYCRPGMSRPGHGRYVASEVYLLPWVKTEAARFRVPERVALGDPSLRRDELEEDRRRAGVAYAARAMSDEEFTATMARLDAEQDRLGAAESVVDVPQVIDWDGWDREAVNAILRTYWDYVQLGPDMRPTRAVWRLPGDYIA